MKRLLAVASGLLLAGLLAGQEVRRPSRRVMPSTGSPTATPTQTPTQTPTPTPDPDPCSQCPDPNSLACTIAWNSCVQCWEDCGQPIATPTPTPSPTHPPTPTPNGPACELTFATSSEIYLVTYYAHESPTDQGKRYFHQTAPALIPPGSNVRPCPCEGYPIGFEWRSANDNQIIKSCGDTNLSYPHIFSDGFESGNTEEWQ